jgi:hypothetical protein
MPTNTGERKYTFKELIERGAPIVSHASLGVVISDTSPNGEVSVARMTYTDKRGNSTVRHVMETGETADESVLQTLVAGLLSEAADNAAEFSIIFRSPSPIGLRIIPDMANPGCLHLQTAWLIRVQGNLRSNRSKQDGTDLLGPITMVSFEDYIKETKGKVPYFHEVATFAALRFLANDKRVYDRYSRHISFGSAQDLSPHELRAIEQYPKKW